MDDPTETPAAEVPPEAPVDTPDESQEPADEPEAETQPDQSPAQGSPIAQAEYTRATQVAAAVRKELGLPKGATQAEVVAAIQAARVQADAGEADDEEEDPRLTAERQRRIESELRVSTAVYGEPFTIDALNLINTIRETDDIEELINLAAAFRDAHGAPPVAPAAAAPDAPAEPGPAEPAIGLSEGDTPVPTIRESTPAGRRESGVVSAIRGIFEEAGIASRQQSPPRQ